MKNISSIPYLFLLILSFVLGGGCAKSTKDMVDDQQRLVDSTPLPPDDEPLPAHQGRSNPNQPLPSNLSQQPGPQAPAISCQMILLPSLVEVSKNGTFPVGLAVDAVELCVGQLPSGERRDELNQFVEFRDINLSAQISLKLVPAAQENAQYHSTYQAQFYTVQNDQYVPVDAPQVYPLNLKSPSVHNSRSIKNMKNYKYLLICKARSSCVQ